MEKFKRLRISTPLMLVFCSKRFNSLFLTLLISLAFIGNVSGQKKPKYILGEEQKLEIIVHIIGEVKNPGEYRVVDGTNVLELLSKSGGPTEFSKLSRATITRVQYEVPANNTSGNNSNGHLKKGNSIIKVNLEDYLKRENASPPLLLKPGDLVLIPRNVWSRWRSGFAVIRDISVIVSVYFLYLRAKN